MPARKEQARAEGQDEHGEADDGEVRGAPPMKPRHRASGKRRSIDRPCQRGERCERVERQHAAPRTARPHRAENEPGGEERESQRERAIRQPIERLEIGQSVIERAGPLRFELPLLQQRLQLQPGMLLSLQREQLQ